MPNRRQLANAIRALSMDAVQAANSGHPGMPMGMADIAEVLWNDYLKHNPADPNWPDRDRFVLSNGHGSMLIYALLHLTGYDLPMQELKDFRQLHSKTAGHPEYGETPGVETTTGPLGQGLANAVGMALAERLLAQRFNRDGHDIVDHYTYAFTGDGCLMEGISHEVCSLAGTLGQRLGLGKLIVFYDDNNISIDGEVEGWFTDDTPKRFEAYGWQVIDDVDGHDCEAITRAIESARSDLQRPTLICCKTVIGYGAPNKGGTAATHGAPLGDEEIAAARRELEWEHAPFEIPEDVGRQWNATDSGKDQQQAWQDRFDAYRNHYPDLAAEFQRRMSGDLPRNFDELASEALQSMQNEANKMATRKASETALNAFGPHLPELIGGSADLTGSNNTFFDGSTDIGEAKNQGEPGNYIYYGVREFGMTAIANGLDLHGGFIAYTGTFLVFSDYARNAVRMSALIPTGAIHVYTHDSIGLGEDGPTHQPIEHLASLRAIPNLHVWRPCDQVETLATWQAALARRTSPTAMALTRQGVVPQPRSERQLKAIARGGYVLVGEDEAEPDAIIIATGSEVQLAVEAAAQLREKGTNVRVVSMPCVDVFMEQETKWRDQVLPPAVKARVAVEAGVSGFWQGLVGDTGRVVGIDHFGASAPASDLFEEFGFTVEHVVQAVQKTLET